MIYPGSGPTLLEIEGVSICCFSIMGFDLQAKGRGISLACFSVMYPPQKTFKIESIHLLGCRFSLQSKAMNL